MDSKISMSEGFLSRKFDKEAEQYMKKYGELLEESQEAFNNNYEGTGSVWGHHNTVGLGQYLSIWEDYTEMFEADPTTRDDMGDFLKVGLGLAALQYTTLPAHFFASVQPLSDEVGMIYFRELIATATRGAITQGDIIGNQGGALSQNLHDYYGEEINMIQVAQVSAQSVYPLTLSAPVRPQTMRFTISITDGSGSTVYEGIDDANGNIFGSWPTAAQGQNAGSINYATGALSLNIDDTVASGWVSGTIDLVYQQNLAQAAELPGFKYKLTSKEVRSEHFILENEYSVLADFGIRKRFGTSLNDDIATSSVAQINSAVMSKMVGKLRAAALQSAVTTFNSVAPAGVSDAEHRRTFTDALDDAMTVIDAATQRGTLSFIIAGSTGRKILKTIGLDVTRKPIPGPYLMGMFENVPVFYAPPTLIPNDEVIVGYRGSSWFESPLVYAPFLPIISVQGKGANPLQRKTALAHAAGIETVVPGFTAHIKIT